jgi:DICT domain-containing protein
MMNLSLYSTIANRYQHLRSIRTVTMMNAISHQIERQVIKHQMPIDFYAGFQRFSAFPQQSQRYQQMGAVCRRIYVFGLADITPPTIPGIEFIELAPDMPLTQEWFLLVDTPEFWTLLSTREAEGADSTSRQRGYDGVWTFDAPVVESASQLLARALEQPYAPVYQRYAPLQEQNVAEVTQRMIEQIEKKRLSSDSSFPSD